MSNVLYDDGNLVITEKYIRFENEIMPTSALSFVSVYAKNVRWWLPILSTIVGFIGLMFYFDMEIEWLLWVSIGLLVYGICALIHAYKESQKRIFGIVAHSGNSISFETDGGHQAILDAIYGVIEGEDTEEDDDVEEANNGEKENEED